MRKSMKLWYLIMAACLVASLSCGCGGSADSQDAEDTVIPDETVIPNNGPNEYNIEDMLDGTWIVIDQDAINISMTSGDNTLVMQLITASVVFSHTDTDDTSGIAFITSHETWHTFLEAETRTYLGIMAINLDNQVMSMVKSGADQWRCEIYDQYRTVMNINVLSDNVIRVEEHRMSRLVSGGLIEYDNVMTLRKK